MVELFRPISWLTSYFIPFQPHRSVKWRLAFLAASFSMILSVASSEELKASRSNLKKALKTESENHLGNPRTVNPNDPKTIDYTLYNYGKSFFFFWKTTHKQNSEVTKLQCFKKKEVLRRNNTKKDILLLCCVSQIRLISSSWNNEFSLLYQI